MTISRAHVSTYRGDVKYLKLSADQLIVLLDREQCSILPACRRLLFPLLHAEKGRLRNAVANRVLASRWQGILFCINYQIIPG